MKTEPSTSPEFDRFKNLLTGLLAVPHSEIKDKMAEYDQQKQERKRKKRAKKPASRVSGGH